MLAETETKTLSAESYVMNTLRLSKCFFLYCGFLSLPGVGYGGAVIEGKVELGDSSKQRRLHRRYSGSSERPAAILTPSPAAVYLEGKFAPEELIPPEAPAVLLQGELQFMPRVLPILVGTSVIFPNEDSTYHNVFSYSSTKRFDLGRYKGVDEPPRQEFDKPGIVKVFCEIHNHMRGTILVLETPYFTVTDSSGNFRLENLPVGEFVLKIWLDDKTHYERSVVLVEGESLNVSFED